MIIHLKDPNNRYSILCGQYHRLGVTTTKYSGLVTCLKCLVILFNRRRK